MSSTLKTAILIVILLAGDIWVVHKTGLFNNRKAQVEKVLNEPIKVAGQAIKPNWSQKVQTGINQDMVAFDADNHLVAWVTSEASGIRRTVWVLDSLVQVALVVDGEAIGRVAKGAASGNIAPVGDEEAVRNIHLTVQAADSSAVAIPFALTELDLAKRWYRRLAKALGSAD